MYDLYLQRLYARLLIMQIYQQAVCDRIIIINKGVIAADGTADEIAKNITNEHKMTVRIEGSTKTAADKDEIVSAVKAISGVKYIRRNR